YRWCSLMCFRLNYSYCHPSKMEYSHVLFPNLWAAAWTYTNPHPLVCNKRHPLMARSTSIPPNSTLRYHRVPHDWLRFRRLGFQLHAKESEPANVPNVCPANSLYIQANHNHPVDYDSTPGSAGHSKS